MSLPNVCTQEAAFRMTCPYQTSFYTATIFWGVLGPKKLFGKGQRYNMMLLGFPIGLAAVLIYWGLRRKFPRSKLLRQIHPVMIISGPVSYYPPFNLAYNLGNLYVNLLSFHYIRKKYLAFWAKVSGSARDTGAESFSGTTSSVLPSPVESLCAVCFASLCWTCPTAVSTLTGGGTTWSDRDARGREAAPDSPCRRVASSVLLRGPTRSSKENRSTRVHRAQPRRMSDAMIKH